MRCGWCILQNDIGECRVNRQWCGILENCQCEPARIAVLCEQLAVSVEDVEAIKRRPEIKKQVANALVEAVAQIEKLREEGQA